MMNGYFDNAATTYKKPDGMYAFAAKYMSSYGANVGRGDYEQSLTSGKLVSETRSKLLTLVGAPEDRTVVFASSATIALNMLIFGINLQEGDTIFISPFEHNAVLRPLYALQKKICIQVKILPMQSDDKYQFDLTKLEHDLQIFRPKAIIVSHVSNVLGVIAPVDEIGKLAKKYDSIMIADGAQACGLVNCDLHFIDYYVFDGHKTLLGPTGIGGFICRKNAKLDPFIFGGTGKDSANHNMPDALPERFEPGTMNLLSIAGLHYSIEWLMENIQFVRKQEEANLERLYQILNNYSYMEIVSPYPKIKVNSIIACRVAGFTSDEFGKILAARGIAVRTGLHCAPETHKYIGSFPEGLIRFSISALTTNEEFVALTQVLDELTDEIV